MLVIFIAVPLCLPSSLVFCKPVAPVHAGQSSSATAVLFFCALDAVGKQLDKPKVAGHRTPSSATGEAPMPQALDLAVRRLYYGAGSLSRQFVKSVQRRSTRLRTVCRSPPHPRTCC